MKRAGIYFVNMSLKISVLLENENSQIPSGRHVYWCLPILKKLIQTAKYRKLMKKTSLKISVFLENKNSRIPFTF